MKLFKVDFELAVDDQSELIVTTDRCENIPLVPCDTRSKHLTRRGKKTEKKGGLQISKAFPVKSIILAPSTETQKNGALSPPLTHSCVFCLHPQGVYHSCVSFHYPERTGAVLGARGTRQLVRVAEQRKEHVEQRIRHRRRSEGLRGWRVERCRNVKDVKNVTREQRARNGNKQRYNSFFHSGNVISSPLVSQPFFIPDEIPALS